MTPLNRSLAALLLLATLALGAPGCTDPGDPECVARTCEAAALACGAHTDGCGGTLECGECASPDVCTATGMCVDPSECVPGTCASSGYACGEWPDGCGATFACPSCSEGLECGSEGQCAASPSDCTNGETRAGDIACGASRAGTLEELCVDGGWQETIRCVGDSVVDFHVELSGDDAAGDGSLDLPWRTLAHACAQVTAASGHRILVGEGRFEEAAQCALPPGVDLLGAGRDRTTVTASSGFFHATTDGGYAFDSFLIAASSGSPTAGDQSIRGLTLDGADKNVYGGLLVRGRSGVEISGLHVQGTYFTGIWLWDLERSSLHDVSIEDCSWGSTGWASGGLNLGNLTDVELFDLTIDEREQRDGDRGGGYGIKAIGPSANRLIRVHLHDSTVHVWPTGLWNDGLAPNIAVEWWGVALTETEISRCEVDNTLSIVNEPDPDAGTSSIRIHHNAIVIGDEAGYPIELSNHRAEVDHNYIWTGVAGYAIAQWAHAQQFTHWAIHHNYVVGTGFSYPNALINARQGIEHLYVFNNTIELVHGEPKVLLYFQGGTSRDVRFVNNIVRRTGALLRGTDRVAELNIDYDYYTELEELEVSHNLFDGYPSDVIERGGYSVGGGRPNGYAGYVPASLSVDANLTDVNPEWVATGERPTPYYDLQASSPALDVGVDVGLPYSGSAPEIGAWEQ